MTDGEDDEQVEIELDDGDTEAARAETAADDDAAAAGENDDDLVEGDLVAELDEGEDAANDGDGESAPTLENKLRRLLRDENRQKIALQRENDALKATTAPKPVDVGKKPDRWEDDFESDEAYDEALRAYDKRVSDANQQKQDQENAQQAVKQRVTNAFQAMRANATKIGLKGYDEAELAVQQTLPASLAEAIPLLLGDQAPALVQILHNNPRLIEKINKAVADDPQLGLAAGLVELTRLSMRIKVPAPKRKTGAKAEEIVRGSAPLSVVSADKKLAELEKAVDQGKPGAQEALMSHLRAKRQQARAA